MTTTKTQADSSGGRDKGGANENCECRLKIQELQQQLSDKESRIKGLEEALSSSSHRQVLTFRTSWEYMHFISFSFHEVESQVYLEVRGKRPDPATTRGAPALMTTATITPGDPELGQGFIMRGEVIS